MSLRSVHDIISPMNRAYELMVVVSPSVDVTDEKKAGVLLANLLGAAIAVKTITLLGKKKLAYPMKKFTEGSYILATIDATNLSVHEIEKKVQLGTDVLRFLVTTK